jgi:hypothetical protein
MAAKYPAIPEPTLEPTSLRDAILSIKQAFEVLTGQRGNQDYRAVLLPELTASDNADDAAIAAMDAAKVSKTGDIMSGPLRVNGGVHAWTFIVRVGPSSNVGIIDNGGGSALFGSINDAGTQWTPIHIPSPVNMGSHLTPAVNGTINLGSAALRWGTVYTSDLSLKNDVGDWTIVEGEDDLFLYNNKKNRVYKFALVEVERGLVPPKK